MISFICDPCTRKPSPPNQGDQMNWIKSSYSSNGYCVEVAWRTSSYSGGNGCVDVGWTESTYCANGACVQVAHEDHKVLVRDSKYEKRGEVSPIIEFTPEGWRVFMAVAEAWKPDPARLARVAGVILSPLDDGGVCLLDESSVIDSTQSRQLHFTREEWDAFVNGVKAGEFTPEVLAG